MNYLPFKVRGGPGLKTALKILPAQYKNGLAGDAPSNYYQFDVTLGLDRVDYCDEIEVSPEEFVSKVNSFIKASKFACKGSPELAQLLDTYHEAGLKDFQNDPCISPDKCYFIWENQLFSRPCSETIPIELFRAHWDSKFGISHKSFIEEKPTVIDKNKVFVKGGEETEEVLCTLLKLGLLGTVLGTSDFNKEDRYFALGSIHKGHITWSADRDYYIKQGLTEITPSEVKALWFPTVAINNCTEPKACPTMEHLKNSKPFGLSQKQTLKIVL